MHSGVSGLAAGRGGRSASDEPVQLDSVVVIGTRASLQSAQQRKRELTLAWRELILAEHTYAHRLRAMLSALGLGED